MLDANELILAGDIGGTNARFGCLERRQHGSWTVHHFAKVKTADFTTFDDAIENYLASVDINPSQAAFAAAGPVQDRSINLTNTSWQISADKLSGLHGFKVCELYNDFAGMTRSIPELTDDDFTVIRPGKARANGPILVAGAGTGFGVGYLIPTRGGWHVMATEGGHIAYSPQSSLELELMQVLRRKRDFVSLELVSSGKGLPTIHKAISEIHGQHYETLAPAVIAKQAKAGNVVARDICQIRAAATMGAIGDLALSGGARGGIVLAGGVSERMIDFYRMPAAMERFLLRGLRSEYVRDIPLRLLQCPFAPLIGAAALLEDQA